MIVAPRALSDLGFPHVLRALAARCRTDMGRERAQARPFLEDPAAVAAALALVAEASALAQEQLSLPLGGLEDIRPSLERAAKHALLEPRELAGIAHVLTSFGSTRTLLEPRQGNSQGLRGLVRRLPDLAPLARRLEEAFDPSGELSDRASPELKAARDRTRGLHRAIKGRLDELLRDAQFAQNLRDGYYSVRNERYVVPVLSSQQAQVPGIVHNASQSGQTLFVEPQEMIGLGNELTIAQALVLDEERRILQELTDQVGAHAAQMAEGVDALAALDEAEAAARLMADLGATLPSLEPATGALELSQLRHPLLVLGGTPVVPNDVRLAPPLRALVVSGPNAGGKTITLTAVGLAALMARAGLPIAAGPDSRIPLFESVDAAVGDAQDLQQGLSTFSAHVVQLRDIGARASPGALVLVDEIAADTDPREGAALAVAVLEDLLERGALVLVTTHLEEIKALAHLDPRFQNARVGFDAARMAPTYRLQLGLAGQSSAIEIAARMGLPERVCQRARQLSAESGGPLSQALAAAERERQALVGERERAQAATRAAEEERAQAQTARQTGERQLAERLAQQQDALKAELDNAAEELRQRIAQLRAEPSLKVVSAARQEVLEKAEGAEAQAEQARAQLSPAPAPPAPLSVGGTARHRRLKQTVQVLELDGEEALVAAGPMRMRVPVSELVGVPGPRPASTFSSGDSRAKAALERAKQAAAAPLESSAATCDVRGLRADDALREVERFLDRTFRQGGEGAVILHGHGTGALKQALRGYLDDSPYVRMFRPGDDREGGDAVTVVAFRS